MRPRSIIAAVLLSAPCTGWAVTPLSGGMVQHLPQAAATYHRSLNGVRLHEYVASDAKGLRLSVHAYLIDIQNGTGAWSSPSPPNVPPFKMTIPSRLQNKIQLFYSTITGWLVVPVRWRLYGAYLGADGGGYFQFNPPAGPSTGWMVAGIASQCTACGPSAVAGLIPDTANAYKKNYELVRPPLSIILPGAKLEPRPLTLHHPNSCTAILAYRVGGEIIHGAVVLHENVDGTGREDQNLYLMLPKKMKFVRFIVGAYLNAQMSTPFYCHGVSVSASQLTFSPSEDQ